MKKLSMLHFRVLDAIRGSNGATDEELFDATGLPPNTCRPRRRELVLMGLVKDSGVRRQTLTGAMATVWEATPRFAEVAA